MVVQKRILALDVGERRIGLAVSDPLGWTAQGLPTLERRNRQTDLEALMGLAQHYEIRMWLVGLPRHMSGQEGTQAAKVRQWADGLGRHSGIAVVYWDERLTTVEAGRVLRAASSSRAQTKRAIDRLSAVLLLQSYLDAQATPPL
ncbi:MAG TPA: Holliday junction resolvase RuvX [Terriglobales bacterium]|nr:Holliday junction resolvase RuvX [Terriglobales bacterium]